MCGGDLLNSVGTIFPSACDSCRWGDGLMVSYQAGCGAVVVGNLNGMPDERAGLCMGWVCKCACRLGRPSADMWVSAAEVWLTVSHVSLYVLPGQVVNMRLSVLQCCACEGVAWLSSDMIT